MRRVHILVALLLALFIVLASPQLVFAQDATKVGESTEENGQVTELWLYRGYLYILQFNINDMSDMNIDDVGPAGNPNPEGDGASGKPSRDDIKEALKRMAARIKGKVAAIETSKNPVTQKLARRGEGLAPIWNPPGAMAGDGVGGTPDSKPTPGAIRDAARRGSGRSGDDDEDEGGSGGATKQPSLGAKGSRAKPERVNPIPVLAGALNRDARDSIARNSESPAFQLGPEEKEALSTISNAPPQAVLSFPTNRLERGVEFEFQRMDGRTRRWQPERSIALLLPPQFLKSGKNVSLFKFRAYQTGHWRVRARTGGDQWRAWGNFVAFDTAKQ